MEFTIRKLHNVWLDNGILNFYSILKNIQLNYYEENILNELEIDDEKIQFSFKDEDKFIKILSKEIEGKRGNLILTVEKDGEKKEIKKDFILIQEGKKIQGKVKLKENIYDSEKTDISTADIFDSLKGEKIKCVFCGREFKRTYKKLQQASYPFATKIKSLSGIRSGENTKLKEYFSEFCALCYLTGILEWTDENLIYRSIPGKSCFLILPACNSLKSLKKVKSKYTNTLNNKRRWCNIKTDAQGADKTKSQDGKETESPSGKFSTLLSFYESFIFNNKERIKQNEIIWYIIEIPSGAVKNLKFYEINFNETILSLFNKAILNGFFIYRYFIKNLYAFNQDNKKSLRDFDAEKDIRENLCEAIANDDFDKFAMNFKPNKSYRIGMNKEAFETLETIIKIWRLNSMDEEKQNEYLKMIKKASLSFAYLIGNRLSLFFKLEKAKDKSSFLEVLQEIMRRFIIDNEKFFKGSYEQYKKEKKQTQEKGEEYKKEWINTYQIDVLIKSIQENEQPFKDTKNLLLIYISLNFGRKSSNKTKESNNE